MALDQATMQALEGILQRVILAGQAQAAQAGGGGGGYTESPVNWDSHA